MTHSPWAPCATAPPAFVASWFPAGVTPDTLSQAPALRINDKDRLQSQWAARHGQTAALPSHRIASSHGFVDACLAGLGWGMNPEPLVAAHLARRTLIDLAPANPLDLPLCWQWARLTARATAPLTHALQQAAGSLGHSDLWT